MIARFPLASVVLALASLAGCRGAPKAEPAEPIVIASNLTPHASLAHVALAKGYFAEEGLAVTVQHHEIGRLALDSMLAGKADLSVCAETPFVFATLRGEHPLFVATIATTSESTAVVARRDAGITAPARLAGMRVGVPFGSSAAFFLDTFLVRHRIDRDAIRLVDLRPQRMADALANREVDAVAIWNPTVLAIQRRMGDAVSIFHAADVHFETHGVAARPELLRERPTAVRKALRALLRAEAFAREMPAEARRLVTEATNADAADTDAMWEQFEFRVRLDQSLLVLMEEEARWAIRAGLVAKQAPPNFAASLAPEPLLAVSPDAVRLIR